MSPLDQAVLGIDSGKQGALCLIAGDGIGVVDVPVVKVKSKKAYDLAACQNIIERARQHYPGLSIAFEDATPMPRQSSVSTWSQAQGIMMWHCFARALKIPHRPVRPQLWKKLMLEGFAEKDKLAAYEVGSRMFPFLAKELKGPRDGLKDGRCDAVLIAEWFRRTGGFAIPMPRSQFSVTWLLD